VLLKPSLLHAASVSIFTLPLLLTGVKIDMGGWLSSKLSAFYFPIRPFEKDGKIYEKIGIKRFRKFAKKLAGYIDRCLYPDIDINFQLL
jgi:hypothetical protein